MKSIYFLLLFAFPTFVWLVSNHKRSKEYTFEHYFTFFQTHTQALSRLACIYLVIVGKCCTLNVLPLSC